MSPNIITIVMFFCGIFIPLYSVHADVITPPNMIDKNYDIHYRVVVYDNLSSYQNTRGDTIKTKENSLFDNILEGKTASLQDEKTIETSSLSLPFTENRTSLETNPLIPQYQLKDKISNESVGSFLDSFKDDPLLNTIYFTSKDLTFNYKKTIANLLQLGFDMQPVTYNDGRFRERPENEPQLTATDKEKINREASNILSFIAKHYSNIIYVFLGMLMTLFIFIRYILNKYI